MSAAAAVLQAVNIADVWQALGGAPLRHGHGRGQAFWRDGDGWNVSLNIAKGTWFDHRDNVGGGILDLVALILGVSKPDALRWVANLAGIQLEERSLSPEDRARWARGRRQIERDLPAARWWRRAAIELAEATLVDLKSRLFDPIAEAPDPNEIYAVSQFVAVLRKLDGQSLVEEFRTWRNRNPQLAAALVKAGGNSEDRLQCRVATWLVEQRSANAA